MLRPSGPSNKQPCAADLICEAALGARSGSECIVVEYDALPLHYLRSTLSGAPCLQQKFVPQQKSKTIVVFFYGAPQATGLILYMLLSGPLPVPWYRYLLIFYLPLFHHVYLLSLILLYPHEPIVCHDTTVLLCCISVSRPSCHRGGSWSRARLL